MLETDLSKNNLLFEKQIFNDWLDSKQACAYLMISQKTLMNLTSGGRIPYYKFGRRNRYKLSELKALLESKKRGVFYGL